MLSAERKKQHELFTSSTGSSSLSELLALCTLPLLLFGTRNILTSVFPLTLRSFYFRILVDFFLIILPTISCLTFLNLHVLPLWICFTLLLFLLFLIKQPSNSIYNVMSKPFRQSDFPISSPSALKATVMLLSCIMIFNVDLPICPRRFAKTHTYGISLMDTGTGMMIAISSFSGLRTISGCSSNACFGRFVRAAVLPLMGLGLIRTCILAVLNYQQPTTEYGVHWNFFFTVAILRLVSFPLTINFVTKCWIQKESYQKLLLYLLSVTVVLFALCSLVHFWVHPKILLHSSWPSTADRSRSVFLANAEGLLSLFGYLGIYFLCLTYLLVRRLIQSSFSQRAYSPVHFLILFDAFVISASVIYLKYIGLNSVSRRFATPAYVVCIFLITAFALFIHTLIYITLFYYTFPSSALVETVSNRAITYFLVSNLITGILNISIDTLNFLPTQATPDKETGNYSLTFLSTASQFLILCLYILASIFTTSLVPLAYNFVPGST